MKVLASSNKNNKGFTLVELLVVVSLIIIVVGVTGDIVISIVRSYNKTQIQNEVEQNLNFALTKLEKDLRNATYVDTGIITSSGGLQINLSRRNAAGNGEDRIIYNIVPSNTAPLDGDGSAQVLVRSIDQGAGYGPATAVTNYTAPLGVTVENISPVFSIVSASDPTVIAVSLTMKQIGSVSKQFQATATGTSTIVVRGTY